MVGPTQEEIDFFENDRLSELQQNQADDDGGEHENEAAADDTDEGAADDGAVEDEPEEPAEDDAEERKRYVPHAALHRERQKRKQLEAQIAEMRAKERDLAVERETDRLRMRALEQRMEMTYAQQQQAQEPKVQIPDYETDPIGHIKARLDMDEQLRRQQQPQVDPAQQRQIEQFRQEMQSGEDIVRKNYTDYDATINEFVAERVKEQIALGYTPQQAQQIVQRGIWSAAWDIRSSGRNPAAIFYKHAKEILSGKKAGPAASATKTASAPVPPPPTAKVAAAQAAQRAVRTLTKADGGKTRREAAAVDLVKRGSKMSDKEFLSSFDKIFKG